MMIWQNPVWGKSARARMRGPMMLLWGVVTLTVTAFVSLLIYFIQTERVGVEPHNAAKAVILGVLILQAVLLMFFGTGAVAHGISSERDEGLVAYQRMTPMTPTSKVLGYLFGLPVREYALVGMTMPFLLAAVFYSGFSLLTLGHFYLVFFLSVIVYHMTALTTGMIFPKPRLAAMLSMGVVVVLYFVLPNLSRIGFPLFEHLTIRPTLFGLVWQELPASMHGTAERSGIDSFRALPWFGGSIHPTVYTVLVQGFLIAVMFGMVHRKWRRENSHVVSKVGAVVVFGGVMLFMLASVWALVVQPEVYRQLFERQFRVNGQEYHVEAGPAMFMYLLMVAMGVVGSLYLLLVVWVTAGRDTAVEGWRRARKRGEKRLGWNSDAASSLPVSLLMMAMAIGCGAVIMLLAQRGHHFYTAGPTAMSAALVVIGIVGAGLFVQGACERLSGRVFAVAMFLLWMVPFFTMVIVTGPFQRFKSGTLIGLPCPPVMLWANIGVMMESTEPLPPDPRPLFSAMGPVVEIIEAGEREIVITYEDGELPNARSRRRATSPMTVGDDGAIFTADDPGEGPGGLEEAVEIEPDSPFIPSEMRGWLPEVAAIGAYGYLGLGLLVQGARATHRRRIRRLGTAIGEGVGGAVAEGPATGPAGGDGADGARTA